MSKKYIEILKEAQTLPSYDCDKYFDKNYNQRTGIYQLCKNCKHILLKHTVNENGRIEPVLSACREFKDQNASCLCRNFA